jgi:uncharacterized protein YecT (DUF1311 family)
MIRAVVLATLMAMVAAPAAQAQAKRPPPSAYERCLAAAQAPAGEIACVTEETRRQDALLNRDYKLILDDLVESQDYYPVGTSASGTMRKAQQAWIAFRDADCRVYASKTWGERADLDARKCMLSRTRERAEALKYDVPNAPEPTLAPHQQATAYGQCMKRAKKLDFREEQGCAVVELERENARLNSTYKTLLAGLVQPADKNAMRAAQRAWIAFRDADCARDALDAGRNGGYASSLCAMAATSDRADQLEAFIKAHPPG